MTADMRTSCTMNDESEQTINDAGVLVCQVVGLDTNVKKKVYKSYHRKE